MKMSHLVFSLAFAGNVFAAQPKQVVCTVDQRAVDGDLHQLVLERVAGDEWKVSVNFETSGFNPTHHVSQGDDVLAEKLSCEFASTKPVQVKCQDQSGASTFSTSLSQTRLGKFVNVVVRSERVGTLNSAGELEMYGLTGTEIANQATARFNAEGPTGPLRNECVVNF